MIVHFHVDSTHSCPSYWYWCRDHYSIKTASGMSVVMACSVKIRELNAESSKERAAVIDAVNECYRGNKNWTNESAIVRGQRINPQKLANDLKHMTVLVAVVAAGEQTERIIGCVQTGIVSKTIVGPLSNPAGYIGMFAVHPDNGGKGVGNKLLNAAEDFCFARGAAEMVMDVLDVRADIMAWYNRKGYRTLPSMSFPARNVIPAGGEELLIDCNFVRMSKTMTRSNLHDELLDS